MRAAKVVIFLIIFSLAFQGMASLSFCDIVTDENTSARMNFDQHDCCDDGSGSKTQCQCNAAVVAALPEIDMVGFRGVMSAISIAFHSTFNSKSFNNIFHPPRFFQF